MALVKKVEVKKNFTFERLLDSIFKKSKKTSQIHVVFDAYKSGAIIVLHDSCLSENYTMEPVSFFRRK